MLEAAKRNKRNIGLLIVGAVQIGSGALVAVAPHLATVLGPVPFAITMIATGVGSAVLAFIRNELTQEES